MPARPAAAAKLRSQASSRGRIVVVPHAPSATSASRSALPRAMTQTAMAAAMAASQSGPSSTPAAPTWDRYASRAEAAVPAGRRPKHQQLGNGASR